MRETGVLKQLEAGRKDGLCVGRGMIMIFVGVESGAASIRRLASESPIKYR